MLSAWSIAGIYILAAAGILLSVAGFFSLDDIFYRPSTSVAEALDDSASQSSQDASEKARSYDRMVLVLIDALRADMVFGNQVFEKKRDTDLSAFMPALHRQVKHGQVHGYIARASLPTVTMPRLKAMTSGRSPAFIDVLKNFNSAKLTDDNLIDRLKKAGFRINLFGDDTWLKLFPDAFHRHDGTSGFYTKDTVEVDDNVTRHLVEDLDPEMRHWKSKDWDALVLHYLGLDHVGHYRGPRSSLMKKKLAEMDRIIQTIQESIAQQDLLRKKLNPKSKPTLFVLCSDHGMTEMGNHGGSSDEESSAVLIFNVPNANRSNEVFQKRPQVDIVPTLAALLGLDFPFKSTGRLLEEVVRKGSASAEHLVQSLRKNCLQLWSLAERKASTKFLMAHQAQYKALSQQFALDVVDVEALEKDAVNFMKIAQEELVKSDGAQYNDTFIYMGFAVVCFAILCLILSLTENSPRRNTFLPSSACLVILYAVSLGSSSSIENEHATCFFLCTSHLMYIAIRSWTAEKVEKFSLKATILLLMTMICARLLRCRNEVINFARLNGLPDNGENNISVISTDPLLEIPLSFVFVLIYLLGIFRVHQSSNAPHLLTYVIYSVALLSSAIHQWMDWNDMIAFSGLGLNSYAYIVYLGCLGLGFLGCLDSVAVNWELSIWLLNALLHRPSNLSCLLVLVTQMAFFRSFYVNHRHGLRLYEVAVQSMLFGFCSFFAFGNTHVVATIDISKAYTGLTAYNQVLVGSLTFLITFSGPLLVFTTTFNLLSRSSDRLQLLLLLGSLHLVLFAVYIVVMYLMRYHLFIWSVFAPKLLYQVAYTLMVLSWSCCFVRLS